MAVHANPINAETLDTLPDDDVLLTPAVAAALRLKPSGVLARLDRGTLPRPDAKVPGRTNPRRGWRVGTIRPYLTADNAMRGSVFGVSNVEPCKGCRHFRRCGEQMLACSRFVDFVEDIGTGSGSPDPTRFAYDFAFERGKFLDLRLTNPSLWVLCLAVLRDGFGAELEPWTWASSQPTDTELAEFVAWARKHYPHATAGWIITAAWLGGVDVVSRRHSIAHQLRNPPVGEPRNV